MKAILNGLLVVCGMSTSIVSADFLGDADDAYLGLQMTRPLEVKSLRLFSGRKQYSLLLLEQQGGIKSGIALTRDSDGMQTLNYLIPSHTFDIGASRVTDYALPVMRLDAQDNSATDNSTNHAVVGLVVLLAISAKIKSDLESDWEVVE